MAEELFTRCPGCKTVFRVTEAQLNLRAGQVRCGHCRTVFNGRDELIALDPPALEQEPEEDELLKGPPTVTLRSAHALETAPPPSRDEPRPAAAGPSAADYENRFAWT